MLHDFTTFYRLMKHASGSFEVVGNATFQNRESFVPHFDDADDREPLFNVFLRSETNLYNIVFATLVFISSSQGQLRV